MLEDRSSIHCRPAPALLLYDYLLTSGSAIEALRCQDARPFSRLNFLFSLIHLSTAGTGAIYAVGLHSFVQKPNVSSTVPHYLSLFLSIISLHRPAGAYIELTSWCERTTDPSSFASMHGYAVAFWAVGSTAIVGVLHLYPLILFSHLSASLKQVITSLRAFAVTGKRRSWAVGIAILGTINIALNCVGFCVSLQCLRP